MVGTYEEEGKEEGTDCEEVEADGGELRLWERWQTKRLTGAHNSKPCAAMGQSPDKMASDPVTLGSIFIRRERVNNLALADINRQRISASGPGCSRY